MNICKLRNPNVLFCDQINLTYRKENKSCNSIQRTKLPLLECELQRGYTIKLKGEELC